MSEKELAFAVNINDKFYNWVDEIIFSACRIKPQEYDKFHRKVDLNSINDVRLKIFRLLNDDFESGLIKLFTSIGDKLEKKFGPDISVQRQINFSVHMPCDSAAILDAHSDSWSGETPFQMNLWIPLTDVTSTNSMFLLSQLESSMFLEKMKKQNHCSYLVQEFVKENSFLHMGRGEGLLFNPDLIHGNVLNTTTNTRLSINVRFKNLWAPESIDKGLGIRSKGNFFRPLIISANSKYALRKLGIAFQEPIVE